MSTEQNKTLARRVNEEGLNRQNPALVDELCAPDFVFHNASSTIQGLQAYKQFLSKFFTAFPFLAGLATGIGLTVLLRKVLK